MNDNLTLNFFNVRESKIDGRKMSSIVDTVIYIIVKLNDLIIFQMIFLIDKNQVVATYTLQEDYQNFYYMDTIEMHDILFNQTYQNCLKSIIYHLTEKNTNNNLEDKNKFTEINLRKILLFKLKEIIQFGRGSGWIK